MVTEEELKNMSPEEISELQKQNCIFCKIINDEVPGKKVFEDDKISAILDIRPATEGHMLVMPKEHFPILPLIPKETSKHMFELTKDLCNAARLGVPCIGTTVFIANGAAAGQQSPHFLFHIIPRNENDGLNFDIPETGADQEDIKASLKVKFETIVKAYLVQEGKLPEDQMPSQDEVKSTLGTTPEKTENEDEDSNDDNDDENDDGDDEELADNGDDDEDDEGDEDTSQNHKDISLDEISRLFK